jgi:hypothetical protein
VRRIDRDESDLDADAGLAPMSPLCVVSTISPYQLMLFK